MPLVKINYTSAGRNSIKKMSVNWEAEALPAPYTEALETKVTEYVDKLLPFWTTEIEVTNATVSYPVAPGTNVPAKRPDCFEFTGKKGKRAVTDVDKMASLDHVLIIKKLVRGGTAGAIELRGCFLDSEVSTNAEGYLSFKNNTEPTFIKAAVTALKASVAPGGTAGMTMPKKGTEANRFVHDLVFDKVGSSQISLKQLSPTAKLNKAVKALMSDLNSDYVDAKYSRSTGATNTLDTVQTTEFNNRAKEITKLMSINKLLKLGAPKEIQALLKSNV